MGKFIKTYLPYILFSVSFICLCLFIVLRINAVLDSDMSSEMLLAKELSKGNLFLTDKWYYSTEIRVLNTQFIFAFLFKIFSDWYAVRVIGSILCFVLFGICLFLFFKVFGMTKIFPYVATLAILPISIDYFQFVIYGLYYIPHICISLITFCLIKKSLQGNLRKSVIFTTFAAVIAVFAGMGGYRQLIIFYVPAFIVSIIVFAINYNSENSKAYLKLLVISFIVLFVSVVGCLINVRFLHKKYSFYSYEINFTGLSVTRLFDSVMALIRMFGYEDGKVMSFKLVKNAIAFIIFFMFILSCVDIVKYKEKYSSNVRYLTFFFIIGYLCLTLLYVFTDMSYVVRYFYPVSFFAIPIIIIYLSEIRYKICVKDMDIALKQAGSIVFIGLIIVSAFLGYKEIMKINNKNKENVCNFLVEQGYNEGLATFWNGNVLTELSNGKLEIWVLDPYNPNVSINDRFLWLQNVSHSINQPDGKLFVLLAENEVSTYRIAEKLSDENMIYRVEGYVVWGFESYGQLQALYD